MTVYILVAVLINLNSTHQQLVINQAAFKTMARCQRNADSNREHFQQIGKWDKVEVKCIAEELHGAE